MDYKVKMTKDAQSDLEAIIQYLLFEKKNEQAAGNVMDDFEYTKNSLKQIVRHYFIGVINKSLTTRFRMC